MNFYYLFTSKMVSIAFDNHNKFLLNTVALIKSAELSTVEVNVNDQSLTINFPYLPNQLTICP